MTSRLESALAELLTCCRPAVPAKPNILKTLLAIQERLGHVPVSALSRMAQTLAVTEAQVAGVLSYYPDLRTEPPGRHVIRVCMGESCRANHGDRVLRALRDQLPAAAEGATSEQRFTLETVSCLGNCALSPTVMIDQDVCGRVDAVQAESLLEPYK